MGFVVDVRCDQCLQLASDGGEGPYPSVAILKSELKAHGWKFSGARSIWPARCPGCIADDNLVAERVEP